MHASFLRTSCPHLLPVIYQPRPAALEYYTQLLLSEMRDVSCYPPISHELMIGLSIIGDAVSLSLNLHASYVQYVSTCMVETFCDFE